MPNKTSYLLQTPSLLRGPPADALVSADHQKLFADPKLGTTGVENYRSDCDIEMKVIDGIFTRDQCGAVGDGVTVIEWVDNIWLHRKKSVYIRSQNIIN